MQTVDKSGGRAKGGKGCIDAPPKKKTPREPPQRR